MIVLLLLSKLSHQASNLVITVGDHGRAEQIALMFEKRLFRHCSSRGFLTITGTYKSTVISIIAIGMVH